MILAIPFPEMSPEIFSFEIGGFGFALRWYAMAYIAAILVGWFIVRRALATDRIWPGGQPPMEPSKVDDLVTYIILGVILGGRLGFVLFYQPAYYLSHPLEILMVWKGGMAFHGGLLGVGVALWLFCRKNAVALVPLADTLALATPPGLFFGRVANFINAELWGRPTDMPWGVIFPGERAQLCEGVVGLCARHPSQLYEAVLEGLVLGAILLWVVFRRNGFFYPGLTAGLFFAGYGVSRFIVEYFRLADPQFITPENPWGHVFGIGPLGVTMGQTLSLPMIILGLVIVIAARRRA